MENGWIDYRLLNIIILGVAFLLIFSAFQTCEMIQEVVLESTKNKDFQGSGFKSLSIIYASFAFFNWFAAPFVLWLGLKKSLILGGATYCLFIGSFLNPTLWALYGSSLLLGFGAAILWTAQGTYVTLLSTSSTIERNTGIFWSLFQTSLVIGNAIMFFKFRDLKTLDTPSYEALFTILLILSCTGWIFIVTCLQAPSVPQNGAIVDRIRDPNTERTHLLAKSYSHTNNPGGSRFSTNFQKSKTNDDNAVRHGDLSGNPSEDNGDTNAGDFITRQHSRTYHFLHRLRDRMSRSLVWQSIGTSFKLFKDRNIILLSFAFAFTGLEMTFVSGILTTCVGYTLHWGELSKPLMGICGMLVGAGEILGGLNAGILKTLAGSGLICCRTDGDSSRPSLGRTSGVAVCGYTLNLACYFLVYLLLPQDSPIVESFKPVYISSEPLSVVLIGVCSLFLGFADSALNTQIYIIIGTHYTEQSAPVFALFKFVQCVAAAFSFCYTKYLLLHWQLLVLATSATLSIYTFMAADYNLNRNPVPDPLPYPYANSPNPVTHLPSSLSSSLSSLPSRDDGDNERATKPIWVDIKY